MNDQSKIRCTPCSKNTHKRVVVKRKELIDITDEMPYHPQVVREFLCVNKIRVLRSTGKKDINERNVYRWFEDVCENHIVIQRIEF